MPVYTIAKWKAIDGIKRLKKVTKGSKWYYLYPSMRYRHDHPTAYRHFGKLKWPWDFNPIKRQLRLITTKPYPHAKRTATK